MGSLVAVSSAVPWGARPTNRVTLSQVQSAVPMEMPAYRSTSDQPRGFGPGPLLVGPAVVATYVAGAEIGFRAAFVAEHRRLPPIRLRGMSSGGRQGGARARWPGARAGDFQAPGRTARRHHSRDQCGRRPGRHLRRSVTVPQCLEHSGAGGTCGGSRRSQSRDSS